MTGRNLSVAIDIGGTFTDIVLADGTTLIDQEKILSTADDYSRRSRRAARLIARAGISPGGDQSRRGWNDDCNERDHRRAGRQDRAPDHRRLCGRLELRRMRVPEIYNFYYEKPQPLVPRRRRYEARERMAAERQRDAAAGPDKLVATLEDIARENVDALAICFLHSYANGAHELFAYEEAQRVLGQQVYVTASHLILPEIREYERTSTTVLNAYVAPVVRAYLMRIVEVLTELGITAPLRVMQSNGGVLGVEAAVLRIPRPSSNPAGGGRRRRCHDHPQVYAAECNHHRYGRHDGQGFADRERERHQDQRI